MDLACRLMATPNDTVALEFRVTNAGDRPVELEFRSGQPAEFVVTSDGEEVWRWSNGRMFTQALWSETVAPGDSVTYDGRWDDPAPGEYEAIATLEAANADVEARSRFTV